MRSLKMLGLGAALALAGASVATSPPAKAQEMKFFRIGSGSAGGTYYPLAGLIAQAISAPPGSRPCDKGGACGVPGLVAVAQSSNGSVANINGIRSGQLEAGLVQSDVTYWAYSGTGLYEGKGAYEDLRIITSLFPEHIHVFAHKNSGIKSVRDLKGKTVGMGLQASGALIGARIVMEAYGLKENTDFTPEYLNTANSVARIKDGHSAAAITVTGYPNAGITELAASAGALLVPIDGAELEGIVKKYPFYAASEIPGGTYQGIPDATKTGTVTALLVTRANVDENLIYELAKAIYNETSQKLFAAGHAKARSITLKTALDGVGIPLHPGAAKYFKEAGVQK
jgi:TRAP transporter TAXI family solute receptor